MTHSRVGEWRRGVYVPSQVVLSQMLFRTLPWALKQAGVTVSQEQLASLTERFWIAIERDGQKMLSCCKRVPCMLRLLGVVVAT